MADVSILNVNNTDYNIRDDVARSSIPSPADEAPLMDGAASVGTSSEYAREDHVHPTDTSRQAALVSGTNIKTVNSTSLLGSGNVSVQPTLVSGTNIKTINGTSILGSGNITIVGSDTNVTQTNTSTDASYRVLLSANANNTTETNTSNKSGNLTFNPSTGALSVSGSVSVPEIDMSQPGLSANIDTASVLNWNKAWNWIETYSGSALADTNVTQINTTMDADYRVLLSKNANDTTETETARKSARLSFNPSTRTFTVGSSTNLSVIRSTNISWFHGSSLADYHAIRFIDGANNDFGYTQSRIDLGRNSDLTDVINGAYHTFLANDGLRLRHNSDGAPDDNPPTAAFLDSAALYFLTNGTSIDTPSKKIRLTSAGLRLFDSDGSSFRDVTYNSVGNWNNAVWTAGTGLSKSSNTLNHSNSVTAQTTQAVYPIKIDAQGHISAYGSAVTNIVQTTATQTLTNKTLTSPTINSATISAGSVVNNPAITSTTTNVTQATWGTADSTYAPTVSDFKTRRWGPVIQLYIRFTTGATGGTGTTRTFFTPNENYKPIGMFYCQVNASGSPYGQVTNASFWFTAAGALQGRAAANTEYRISCTYIAAQ